MLLRFNVSTLLIYNEKSTETTYSMSLIILVTENFCKQLFQFAQLLRQ